MSISPQSVITKIHKKRQNRIKRTRGELIFDIFNHILMVVISFVMLYPFWYVLVLSLNDGADSAYGGIWFWPRVFTLDNYKYILANPQLQSAYLVTIARTVIGTAITVLTTGFAAYAMSKRNLRGRKVLLTFFMIPMFIGGTTVSTYVVFAKLHLLNNFLVYVLPSAFSFYYMVVMRTFIYGLPPSLEESAKIDGAGHLRIFFKIIMPLCVPVVATVALFSAVAQWLDFSTNLMYVYDSKLTTVQYLLYQVVRANKMTVLNEQAMAASGALQNINTKNITSQSVQMTVLMVATLPIVVVYPFVQKYFVKGLTLGAIKE